MVITLDWGAVIFFSQFCSLGLNSYKRLFATIFSATQRCNIASTSQRCVALKIVVANLPAKHHLYARKLEVNSFSLYALLGAAETRQCDYRDGFKVSNSFHDCEQPHKNSKIQVFNTLIVCSCPILQPNTWEPVEGKRPPHSFTGKLRALHAASSASQTL